MGTRSMPCVCHGHAEHALRIHTLSTTLSLYLIVRSLLTATVNPCDRLLGDLDFLQSASSLLLVCAIPPAPLFHRNRSSLL
jgi:hypothetical protein